MIPKFTKKPDPERVKEKPVIFLVRAYTKPKLLTGNKLWRARTCYDEFFV